MKDSDRVDAESVEPQNRQALVALAILRIGLGALFISVFFENLSKGLYSPSGYSGLINYYIEKGHAPLVLKSVMALMASHASVAGPMQGFTEITFGFLLVVGFSTRLVALAAFLFLTTLWIAESGTAWIWELLIPMIAALSLAIGAAGRKWGIDALMIRKYPRVPLW
ncbi:MAG: TQO small subunit DoxD [bacterium]